jgi:hypothetical protein
MVVVLVLLEVMVVDLNLSNWCVENITSAPNLFATSSPFADTPSNLPGWGTWPAT